MKVKELEIVGFKSFVDKVKLAFKPGITALVGPNGCGKSNVIDAFRWIMGEQNARNLRGKIMEDLIFNGSESRKPLGMAEVSMVLSNENGHAADDDQVRELMVTRRLYRSGESEYFINKIPCRLKDIVELFLDAGVGLKSYSIMEQGRVDHILSLKPPERRVLIEEVAGIAKYRARKKEALSKMESTRQNLLRIHDILNEIQNQLSVLEKQVKRLNRYRKIKEEIKEIDLLLAAHKYHDLKESETRIKSELSALNDEEIRIATQKESAEAGLQENRLLLTESQHKFNDIQNELFQIKNSITAEESRLEYNKKEVHNITDLLDKNARKLEELNAELAGFDADVEARRGETASLQTEIESNQHLYSQSTQAVVELKNRLEEIRQRIENEKGELIAIVTARTQVKNAMQLNLNLQREITQRLNRLASEQNGCQVRLQEISDNTISLEQQLQEMNAGRKEKEAAIAEHQQRIEKLSTALQDKETALHDLKEKTGVARSRLISLKDLQKNLEGFDEGVRTIMNKHGQHPADSSGIVGLLADIIETVPEYETAVESALGRKLQSIIVRNNQNCFESIAYLKQSDGGRVSFVTLALDTARHAQSDVHTQFQHLQPLAAVIKTAPEYQQVVDALLGDVFVVENLQQAITLRETVTAPATFVTMDGDIVEPAGVITGGSRSTATSGILQRNREIRQLTEELERLEAQLRILGDERETMAQELSQLKDVLETLNRAKNELDLQLFQQDTVKAKYQEEAQQCQEKIDLIQAEHESYARDLVTHQQELKDLIVKEGSFKYSDDELQEALRNLQQSELSFQDEVKDAEARAVDLRVKLEVAQQRYESALENLNALLQTRTASESKVNSLCSEIEELQQQRERLAAEITQTQQHLLTLLAKNDALDRTRQDEKDRAQHLEEAVAEGEASIRKLRELEDEIEPRIHSLDLDLKEVSLRGEHLSGEIAERYNCAIPELPLPEPEGFSLEENQERLDKLRLRLTNIGEVNLAASTEYDESKKRYDFLYSQEQDLTQSLESLQKVIARINRTTKEKFQDAFNQVNAHFQEIFPILFHGGKAYLSLTDESDLLETGIEIFVQPSGKKLQSLDLLSGGERSLTVVALIFAIFLTKPSPFCLLDEIDAALDDSNIDRFNQHLQKMSGYSQFIMVTHSKQSMQAANTLYGVTMQEQGVSKIVSVDLH